MVYNEKYNRWCDTTGKIFRQTKDGKFIECKQSKDKKGYLQVKVKNSILVKSHRLIWETFNSDIPCGFVIDHINTIRDDNRLVNLRCCTTKENNNNELTRLHTIDSDFGKKYFEYYGYGKAENINQYDKERMWYRRHNNTCRWEVK
jgi:hypothetical protein